MKTAIVHADVGARPEKDEQDVLVQAAAVERSLGALGHASRRLPVTLDLGRAAADLGRAAPDLVFNLVESLEGTGRFAHCAPLLFEHLSIPFTGSGSEALYLTTGKTLAKDRLRHAQIPTPDWTAACGSRIPEPGFAPPYIVKPVWEDASVGIDDASVVRTGEDLGRVIRDKRARHGECFVEAFIDGREFNISLLADAGGVQVLPPAEILFDRFPAGKPRIVGYEAKWEEGSFDYRNTPRTFQGPPEQAGLCGRLEAVARRCWDLFGLRGYARVDFRVDPGGRPWVIEVNANPCIAPDAGFTAAAGRAGIPYDRMIARILDDAFTAT